MKKNILKSIISITILLILFLSKESPAKEVLQPIILELTKHIDTQVKLYWGQDPFLQLPGFEESRTEEPPFQLEAILFSEKNPVTVINGRTLQEGDEIEDYTIHTIGPNYIVLGHENSLIELNFSNSSSPERATTTQLQPQPIANSLSPEKEGRPNKVSIEDLSKQLSIINPLGGKK